MKSARQACCLLASLLVICGLTGCKGRTIKVENPVFAAAPPRRSLTNHSADAEESRLAQAGAQQSGANSSDDVRPVSYSRLEKGIFTGTTVVAEVNGKPVFVDDVLGGGRQLIESDPRLGEKEQQIVIENALKKRLPKHIEDELILQALETKIPKDKRDGIRASLEPKFQEFIEQIKQDNNFTTNEEVQQKLATEGSTINSLRDLFMRSQLVDGYVFSLSKAVDQIDREELLKYYEEHISEYTPDEKIRYAEIVIRFAEHGGEDGAKKAMTTVVNQLLAGKDFNDVASAMSDVLSAENGGDKGWVKRGELSDQALEETLFSLGAGEMTKVFVRPQRFEVYKVIDHRSPARIPFQTVQKEIEQKLLSKGRREAAEQVRREIVAKGNVITVFDNDPTPETAGSGPGYRTPF